VEAISVSRLRPAERDTGADTRRRPTRLSPSPSAQWRSRRREHDAYAFGGTAVILTAGGEVS
jgi:hypothetical protein